MINKIVKTVRTINKNVVLKDFAIAESNGRVKKMRQIERMIKRVYNIKPEVIYVDEKHKALFHKSSVKGAYTTDRNRVVVYLNKDYKANIKTLCHELTHSYQHTHNTERYLKSCEALREGRVLYRNAWHEVDARQQAEIMCEYYYGLKNVI